MKCPLQALIDSQSVKTTGAVDQNGFDMGKKTKGIKRRVVTDEIGCLLDVVVHKAILHDTKIGYWVAALATFTYPTLEKICADGGLPVR